MDGMADAEMGLGIAPGWSGEQEKQAILARLGPEPGWSPLDVPPARIRRPPGQGAFVPSEPDGRLCLRCYVRESDRVIVAKAWFGPGAEGPPGHAHGGSQAAVMDHVLGAAAWAAGYPCFTASLTHDYRRPLPLDSVALAEAWVEEVAGRKVKMAGRLTEIRRATEGDPGRSQDQPLVYGEARGLFLQINGEKLTQMAAVRRRVLAGLAVESSES